jgi:MFS transporter, DHA2 family, multidrug resistance protein
VSRVVPAGRLESSPPFDWIGFGLLSTCMVAFSLALDVPMHTHRVEWCIALIVVSAAAAFGYVPHARRRKSPLFRLGLFREPNFGIGLLGNLVARVGSSAVPFLLPLLLQLQLGYSPLRSGMAMIPAALGGILSKSWISGLVRRYGYDNFLLVNTTVVGASIASFAVITPQWPVWVQLLQLGVFGASNSMQFAAMNSVTLKGLDAADAGSGNSLFSMVQMLALGMGATIGGGLVGLLSGRLESTAAAFRYTFIVVGAITLMSGFIFRWLDDVKLKPTPAATSDTDTASAVLE